MNKTDNRYPFTYAADYIRGTAGYNAGGTILGRAEASRVREGIAVVLGMSGEELAKKIADYYIENEEVITQDSVDEFLREVAARKRI